MSLRVGQRRLGGLQHELMELFWSDGGWLTPRQAAERLEGGRAYTTVMTVLTRLAAQEILVRRRAGRAYEYQALRTREQFYADRLADVLHGSRDLEATLARFVAELSPAQRLDLSARLTLEQPMKE